MLRTLYSAPCVGAEQLGAEEKEMERKTEEIEIQSKNAGNDPPLGWRSCRDSAQRKYLQLTLNFGKKLHCCTGFQKVTTSPKKRKQTLSHDEHVLYQCAKLFDNKSSMHSCACCFRDRTVNLWLAPPHRKYVFFFIFVVDVVVRNSWRDPLFFYD